MSGFARGDVNRQAILMKERQIVGAVRLEINDRLHLLLVYS